VLRNAAEAGRTDEWQAIRLLQEQPSLAAMRARWPGTDDGFVLLGRVVGFSPSR
jgi:hypothetical protein